MPPRRAATFRSAVWAGGALLLEYLILSMAFDVLPLGRAGGWATAFGALGSIAPLWILFVAATYLVTRASVDLEGLEIPAPRPRWPWVVGHLLTYMAFYYATVELYWAETLSKSGVMLWLALGGLTGITVLLTVVDVRALPGAFWRLRKPLGMGGVVAVAAWLAGIAAGQTWSLLAPATLRTSGWIARHMIDGVTVDPASFGIGTASFNVVVAPVCSGYEGVGLAIVFSLAFLWLFRDEMHFPRAWLLVPAAMVVIWVANAFRIASLIAVGTYISPAVALGGFHSKAGWVLFCGLALVIASIARRTHWLRRTPPTTQDADTTWNPTALYLTPLLAWTAAALVGGAFVVHLETFYALRVVAGLAALAWVVPRIPALREMSGGGAAIAVVAGLALGALWVGTAHGPGPQTRGALASELAALGGFERTAWIAARVVGGVLVAPVVEELAFRGYLMRRLQAFEFTAVPYGQVGWNHVIIASLVFGVLHGEWILGIVAGLVFGAIAVRTGRLAHAVLAHMAANAVVSAYALWADAPWLWA